MSNHHNRCTVARVCFIRTHSLDAASGETTPVGDGRWVTGPCDAPLFTPQQQLAGVCASCERGFNHPENYRADGPRPTHSTENSP